jgi:signal transduction histidine kinase/ActR/RegA family two-component response regulator
MFKRLYNHLTTLGFSDTLSIEETHRLKLTNTLGIFPVAIYLFFIGFGIVNNYWFPPVICTGLIIGVIVGLYCNHLKKYLLAKFILFGVNSFSVLVIQNVLNIDHSITCYFFALFIAYQITYDIKQEMKGFIPAFAFTLLCWIGCFVLPPQLVFGYNMTPEIYASSVVMNYVFPTIISVFFLFTIANIQTGMQQKMKKALTDAEQANKAKSSFLSNMSHELRTPLNGIVGATNLLKHENVSLSQQRYFDIINNSSDQMLSLINDILDFSKIETGKISLNTAPVDLHKFIEKTAAVFANRYDSNQVNFTAHIDKLLQHTKMETDDLRLMQVLNNLLSNAFKFTKKGSVVLSATVTSDANNTFTILFSVRDTGIGIAKDKQAKVFESFEQADNSTTKNFGGTGLGLTISKQLVALLGGELQLQSEPDAGSDFYFSLTLPKAAAAEEKTKEIATTKEALKGLRILVAEDNRINVIIVRNFLKKWGVHITEATNGKEAIGFFAPGKFDIVLLDLEMPEMDGYSAVSFIRQQDTDVPVFAFTAALYNDMAMDLERRGFSGFIYKPFNPDLLYEKLSDAIKKPVLQS